MADEEYYRIISNEMASNKMDAALWTQAFSLAEGDSEKAKAVYIRLRLAGLKKSASLLSATLGLSENASANSGNNLPRLRADLTEKLRGQGKSSLYSSLGLNPAASDDAVAKAIADCESGVKDNSFVASAEFNYAKEILRDPLLREQYDRKLMETMSDTARLRSRISATETMDFGSDNVLMSWWESSKTSVVIGVLSLGLLGYLGLKYINERNHHEVQTEVVRSTGEVENGKLTNEQLKIETDAETKNRLLSIAQERSRQEMDIRANAAYQQQERQREQQDRQREEQDRRLAQEQERQKLQQQQNEERKIQKERQYWACMNSQLNNGRPMEADARCAMYR